MWSGGKNEKHVFCWTRLESQFKQNAELSSTTKEKKKTAQIVSKQAIGYPRVALKRQVSSLKHN